MNYQEYLTETKKKEVGIVNGFECACCERFFRNEILVAEWDGFEIILLCEDCVDEEFYQYQSTPPEKEYNPDDKEVA